MQLGSDLIFGPKSFPSTTTPLENTTGGISSTRHKKRNDLIVTLCFQDLLQISPDNFEEVFLADLVPKKLVPAQGKGVSNRKNTTELIQSGLGVVEKEREHRPDYLLSGASSIWQVLPA